MADARLSIKVSSDAREASASFRALADDIKKVGTESVDVTEGMQNVARALEKVERAKDSPGGLAKAVGLAKFHVDELRESLEKAGPAGVQNIDRIAQSLQAAEARLATMSERAGKMKDAIGDVGDQSKIAADKIEALRQGGADIDTLFDRMTQSSSGTVSSIGNFGKALGVASVAITGAISAGKELAENIDKLSAKYAAWQQKKIDSALLLQKQEIALRAADRGLIEHGKNIAETVENYDKYALSQGKLSEGARKVAEEIGGLKIPPTYEDLGRQVEAIGLAFEGAYKRGEEFGDRMLLENASVIEELVTKYEQLGKEVPEDLAELAKSLEQLKGAGEGAASGLEAVADKTMTLQEAVAQVGPSLDGMRERIMDTSEAWKVAAAVNAQYAAALNATAVALNDAGRTIDQQEAWDRNTAALNDSTAALQAQDQALQDGMDAWASAGVAMGEFAVDVRQATAGYVETGDAALDLIERMAKANDQLGDLAVFAGSWIAELEKGNITTGEFRKRLDELSVGLPYYSALLRAAGVDAAETAQAISGMYAALNDATFLRPAAEWWEQFGISMESAFFKARDAAKTLREELEDVEVVAGRVNAAVSGPRGTIDPEDLEDGMRKPSKPKREPGYR